MASKFRWCGVAAAYLVLVTGGCALADDRTTNAELLRRIEALEAEVRELRAKQRGNAGSPAAVEAAPADQAAKPEDATAGEEAAGKADSTGPRGAITARRIEPDEPAPQEGKKPKSKPVAGYDEDGFFLSSADGLQKLRLEAYVQADGRFFADDGPDENVDEFVIRRARLDLKAKFWKRYSFRLTPDFAGSSLSLRYAYAQIDFADWFMLRAGKQKTPFGIEQLESGTDLPVVERGLPDNLAPSRDIGVQILGDPFDGRLAYSFAVLNGVPDGSNGDGDVNDAVDLAMRIFATPYAPDRYSPLRGAGFGIAGMWGRQQGTESSPQLPDFETTGRTDFFEYADDVFADGDRWRVSPQASWYEGPFGLLTEYVRTSQQVSLDDTRAWITNQAWQVRGSWILTGERASEERVVPDSPFDFGGGGWGAWQLALRWASLDVDKDAFSLSFADPTDSARNADAIGAAVNWYLNRHVSMYLHYEHTMFEGGGNTNDRADENVFISRMQIDF